MHLHGKGSIRDNLYACNVIPATHRNYNQMLLYISMGRKEWLVTWMPFYMLLILLNILFQVFDRLKIILHIEISVLLK